MKKKLCKRTVHLFNDREPSLSSEVGTNFADKRLSLCRYSSLADLGHGIYLFFLIIFLGDSCLFLNVMLHVRGNRHFCLNRQVTVFLAVVCLLKYELNCEWGSVVFEALFYKLEGREFDSLRGSCVFQLT
jgi:hypothetical protein